jgi:hypothetical protein
MTNEQAEYIKSSYKWPFSWTDFLLSYPILIAPILLIIFSTNDLLIFFSYTKTLIVILGLFLTFYIIHRIESERCFLLLTVEPSITFREISDKLELLNWIIIDIKSDRIQFLDKSPFLLGGVCVTIIRYDNNKILVNSKPFGGQPFTLYREKINYKKIKQILQR